MTKDAPYPDAHIKLPADVANRIGMSKMDWREKSSMYIKNPSNSAPVYSHTDTTNTTFSGIGFCSEYCHSSAAACGGGGGCDTGGGGKKAWLV